MTLRELAVVSQKGACFAREMSITAQTVGRNAQSSLQRLASALTGLVARYGIIPVATVGLLHLAAFGLMAWYEASLYSMLVFVLTWGLLNFFWLVVLRRAAIAAALSLLLVVTLITFSEFKFGVL